MDCGGAARKAGFSEEEIAFLRSDRIDDQAVESHEENRMPSGREMYMRIEAIATKRDGGGATLDGITEEDLWTAHRNVMGDVGKFASEFLLTADIDGVRYPVDYRKGVKDGSRGWNYVAFSDEHLRVDHVYEYNPETDDFERKWHDSAAGGVPEFTETPLGQELVARAFDAIVGSRVDLLLRPSRYYGAPYESGSRRPQDALLVERLNRDVDVSTPEGFAAEVSAEISRFGTREGDPTLREIRARCGNKRNFYAVLGAVYETAENLRNGLGNVVTDREHAMGSGWRGGGSVVYWVHELVASALCEEGVAAGILGGGGDFGGGGFPGVGGEAAGGGAAGVARGVGVVAVDGGEWADGDGGCVAPAGDVERGSVAEVA